MSIDRSVNLAYGFMIPTSNTVALDALSDHLLGKEYADDLGLFVNEIYENRALDFYPSVNIDTSVDQATGSIIPTLLVFNRKTNRSLYGNYEIFDAFGVNSQEVDAAGKEKLEELLAVVKAVSPDIELDFIVWMSLS